MPAWLVDYLSARCGAKRPRFRQSSCASCAAFRPLQPHTARPRPRRSAICTSPRQKTPAAGRRGKVSRRAQTLFTSGSRSTNRSTQVVLHVMHQQRRGRVSCVANLVVRDALFAGQAVSSDRVTGQRSLGLDGRARGSCGLRGYEHAQYPILLHPWQPAPNEYTTLAGRVALVTGANTGIGLVTARAGTARRAGVHRAPPRRTKARPRRCHSRHTLPGSAQVDRCRRPG